MLNKYVTTSALILAIAAGQAYADDRGTKGDNMPGTDFATVDANGDGQITADELQANADARFTEIDTDGDGELSLAEMQAKAGERRDGEVNEDRAAKFERMFNAMDKDGSGTLSAEERPRGEFDADVAIARMDANSDGVVTEDEFGQQGRKGGHGKGRKGDKKHR